MGIRRKCEQNQLLDSISAHYGSQLQGCGEASPARLLYASFLCFYL